MRRTLPFGRLGVALFVAVLVGVPLVGAAVLGDARQLHRALQHRGPRTRPAHRRGRADLVRAGRVRRHRRVHDGDPLDAIRDLALAQPVRGAGAHAGAGAVPRLHHAADERALSPARDHRLGHQPLLPVRQSRVPRRAHRAHRHTRAQSVRDRAAQRALLLFPHLGHRAGGALGDEQPARLAAGPRGPRAARPARNGGGLRRQRRAAQDRRLRLRGAAGVRSRAGSTRTCSAS